MAIRNIGYFFNVNNQDRLNTGDVPTEQTFRDLLNSIAFFRESSSAAELKKAGLVKKARDGAINDGDIGDAGQNGVSPLGFPTFVQPHQLPRIVQNAGYTVSKIPRSSGADEDLDTGNAIEDYQLNINFPAFPAIPEDTEDIVTVIDRNVNVLTAVPPYTLTVDTVPAGSTLKAFIDKLLAEYNQLAVNVRNLSLQIGLHQVQIGDIVLTPTPANTWPNGGQNGEYVSPEGQLLSAASYPELYALIGNEYGGVAGVSFNLPNLDKDRYLRAVRAGSSDVGDTGGQAEYNLVQANIPQHFHSINITTDTHAGHTHSYIEEGNSGSGVTTRQTDIGGQHNHNVNGNTGTWGTGVSGVPVDNEHINFFLKMRIK